MKTVTKATSSTTTGQYKLLKVDWVDAAASIGWDTEPSSHRAHHIESVGWLTLETKEEIVLSADISSDDGRTDTNRRMAIPKGWIKSRKEIKL